MLAATALSLATAGHYIARRRMDDLMGQVALITGGSRGLGLALAREFADAGCKVAICARDADELVRAKEDLDHRGAETLAIPCDVTDRTQAEETVAAATRHFGRVDILVNDAGIIQTGPIGSMTIADFERAMAVIFWGALYMTFAVLPQMRERRYGRIVNISSVGGKVSVPHLLPYCAAKFAMTGFSEGLRAELAQENIHVTTVAPGTLRTGGYLNAVFTGDAQAEFTWFSLGDALPFAALDATQAAREIVAATRRGDAECMPSVPAALLARLHGVAPALVTDLLGAVNRFVLPSEASRNTTQEPGRALQERAPSLVQRVLRATSGAAARDLNQPGSLSIRQSTTVGDDRGNRETD